MEYSKDTWVVTAYDLKDRPMYTQQYLKEWVAKRIFHTWAERADVGRVECYDLDAAKDFAH